MSNSVFRANRAIVAMTLAAACFGAVLALPSPQPLAAQGGATWVRLADDAPLYGHAAIVDASADRMLVVGGESAVGSVPSDSRAYDLRAGTWASAGLTGSVPVSRLAGRGLLKHSLALDPVERLVVAEGNFRDGSTYLLDLTALRWSAAPQDRDLGIAGGTLVYDPTGDRALLFGGLPQGVGPADGAGLAYDLSGARAGWRDLPPAPFQLVYQAAMVDAVRQQAWAFGGVANDGEMVARLWRLDLQRADQADAWTDCSDMAGPGPSPRVGATFVYDPDARTGLLFAGLSDAGEEGDVWALDLGDSSAPRWREIVPTGDAAPAARSAHSAVWDPVRQRMIVYGGLLAMRVSGSTVYDDAWALQWGTEPTPTVTASPSPPMHTPTPAVTSDGRRWLYMPLASRGAHR